MRVEKWERLFGGKADLRVIQYDLLYLDNMKLRHGVGHPGHVGVEGDGVDDLHTGLVEAVSFNIVIADSGFGTIHCNLSLLLFYLLLESTILSVSLEKRKNVLKQC